MKITDMKKVNLWHIHIYTYHTSFVKINNCMKKTMYNYIELVSQVTYR